MSYDAGLKAVRHTILDVQSTIWHDEYLKFRTGTKELEVMVQNLINGIFSTITTVQEGVEILEIFSDMGSREVCSIHPLTSHTNQALKILLIFCFPFDWPASFVLYYVRISYFPLLFLPVSSFFLNVQLIRRVIDKQTVELYAMFTQEINHVKRVFSRQAPVAPRSQPHYACQAAWARLLKRRIDTPMKVHVS